MLDFALWLASTSLSYTIQTTAWVIPGFQSVHIMAIATILASTLFMNLRLLKKSGMELNIHQTAARFLPWVWGALAVLVITGTVLIIGEPERELLSSVFWAKMVFILIGVIATAWLQITINRSAKAGAIALPDNTIRLYVFGTFIVWLVVICLGRLIAYIY